jgi:hypothetical protein
MHHASLQAMPRNTAGSNATWLRISTSHAPCSGALDYRDWVVVPSGPEGNATERGRYARVLRHLRVDWVSVPFNAGLEVA